MQGCVGCVLERDPGQNRVQAGMSSRPGRSSRVGSRPKAPRSRPAVLSVRSTWARSCVWGSRALVLGLDGPPTPHAGRHRSKQKIAFAHLGRPACSQRSIHDKIPRANWQRKRSTRSMRGPGAFEGGLDGRQSVEAFVKSPRRGKKCIQHKSTTRIIRTSKESQAKAIRKHKVATGGDRSFLSRFARRATAQV
jgi:hypothetical protein